MVTRIGGMRRKTRGKMKKDIRAKGKISITRFFQEFKNGEKVNLSVEPAVQKGMYHPRFMGKTGVVTSKTGECYKVKIKDNSSIKELIVHPVHLKKA